MQFLMPEKALPEQAEVAVLMGLHQKLGGPFKLVYLFRRFKCVHVYECVSQGREWWFTLHMSTDHRYCLRSLQPYTGFRSRPYPEWWKHGAGCNPKKDPAYPMSLHDVLLNDISGSSKFNSSYTLSVLLKRDAGHELNLSGGQETMVPARFLYGLLPECLLDQYRFWQVIYCHTNKL